MWLLKLDIALVSFFFLPELYIFLSVRPKTLKGAAQQTLHTKDGAKKGTKLKRNSGDLKVLCLHTNSGAEFSENLLCWTTFSKSFILSDLKIFLHLNGKPNCGGKATFIKTPMYHVDKVILYLRY